MKRVAIRKSLRAQVYAKCDGRCAYCGVPLTMQTMHVDHIRPCYFSGNGDLENLNPSCRACNNYKATFGLEDFRGMIRKQIELCRKHSMNFRTAERFGFVTTVVPDRVEFYFERAAMNRKPFLTEREK